jgi:hypothetical protein
MANKKKSKKKAKKSTKKKQKKTKPTTKPSSKKTRRKATSTKNAVRRIKPAQARSGGQSGDLQGLSNVERADSESVDELLEEGNTFEAGVVEGVERADDSDEREVRTREFPEDDVPEEYLDKE